MAAQVGDLALPLLLLRQQRQGHEQPGLRGRVVAGKAQRRVELEVLHLRDTVGQRVEIAGAQRQARVDRTRQAGRQQAGGEQLVLARGRELAAPVEVDRPPHQLRDAGQLGIEGAGIERVADRLGADLLVEQALGGGKRRLPGRRLPAQAVELDRAHQQRVERQQRQQQQGGVDDQQAARIGAHGAPQQVAEGAARQRQQRRDRRRAGQGQQQPDGPVGGALDRRQRALAGQVDHLPCSGGGGGGAGGPGGGTRGTGGSRSSCGSHASRGSRRQGRHRPHVGAGPAGGSVDLGGQRMSAAQPGRQRRPLRPGRQEGPPVRSIVEREEPRRGQLLDLGRRRVAAQQPDLDAHQAPAILEAEAGARHDPVARQAGPAVGQPHRHLAGDRPPPRQSQPAQAPSVDLALAGERHAERERRHQRVARAQRHRRQRVRPGQRRGAPQRVGEVLAVEADRRTSHQGIEVEVREVRAELALERRHLAGRRRRQPIEQRGRGVGSQPGAVGGLPHRRAGQRADHRQGGEHRALGSPAAVDEARRAGAAGGQQRHRRPGRFRQGGPGQQQAGREPHPDVAGRGRSRLAPARQAQQTQGRPAPGEADAPVLPRHHQPFRRVEGPAAQLRRPGRAEQQHHHGGARSHDPTGASFPPGGAILPGGARRAP